MYYNGLYIGPWSIYSITRRGPLVAGLLHGVAVHFRIFPVVYAHSF